MVGLSPFAYFLQTLPPIPKLPPKIDEEIVVNEKKQDINQTEVSLQEEIQYRPLEDISAPDIKTALKEAFTSPTFILITLGFSVCGFHIAFLSTHLPAYFVRIVL